ncbi:MAG TPA: hypothetical protein VGH28_07620 [Polyangiaceae bacterium]|jgi:hypothetical protein
MSFTKLERSWARAALGTMFPSGAHPRVPGADAIDGGASLEDVCLAVPARVALGIRIAVWMVALAPLFVVFRLRTLAGLETAAREKVVLALLSSRFYFVRQLTLLLKAFGALIFVAAPGVRQSIVGRESLVRLGRKEEAFHAP